ncbi:polysaccharide biosynthesis/export family protein [Myroides sp. N17-2]|uniref:polysaccharide biosynthesis/export family protein n=1 Tax=Myroides sp. N17-2 TaxID=2030799 RepID=UPI000EFAEF2F|nr:polysaccharide biosynthesis/export family protein [Myroides sp. N17-2]
MKNKIALKLSLFLGCMFLLGSCANKKDIIYYQNVEDILLKESNENKFETRLRADDLLMIIVSAQDPEAAAPFNLINTMTATPNNPAAGGTMTQQLYLIDSHGNIQFPVLGTIKLGGKSKEEAIALLSNQISQYITNPIVNLRIMNYKVTVQGEVNNPGVHKIDSERLTLAEAIALSGDLTVYGKRDNILLIREIDGRRVPIRVDMTKADFMVSPYYYLNQNDIVYVEPNKTKVNSSVVGPNLSLAISALSLLVTIIALSIK